RWAPCAGIRLCLDLELLGGNLDAATRAVECRESVNAMRSALQFPDENRHCDGKKRRRITVDIEPVDLLPIDFEMPRQLRIDERREPGSGRDDQSLGCISTLFG